MSEMSGELIYRPFEPRDFDALANLLGDKLWCSELGETAGRVASRIELCGYLAATTYSLVAEKDGELLGAMLLAERDREPLDEAKWREKRSKISLLARKDAKLAEKVAHNSDVIAEEDRLAEDFAATGAPEAAAVLKLLVVDPKAHGLGIGGRLFEAARDRLRETGAGGFFLLTDDSCDFSFYDHKGLVRAMSRSSEVEMPAGGAAAGDGPFNLYVYAQRL